MKKNKKWLFLIVAGVLLLIWMAWGNTALELNEYSIQSKNLPDAFDGFRIVQISDLHNAEIGKQNETIIKMTEEAKPDIIVLTGDLVDSRRTDVKIAIEFVKQVVEIAPCYYVTGNHESAISEEAYAELEQGLIQAGVMVLHNEMISIERGEQSISLAGVDDPWFTDVYDRGKHTLSSERIKGLFSEEGFQILLSHRPELFQVYVNANVDLVFSGHAHGGQFRFPFVGGVYAPHQGIFPEYDAGLFSKDETNMLVSRGIGNSIFPLRINNRPEVVVVELRSKIQ